MKKIFAACGTRVPSWNKLRTHEKYCGECVKIKRENPRL